MEIEFLKKTSERLSAVKVSDIIEAFQKFDLGHPLVMGTLCVALIVVGGLFLYLVLGLFSSDKKGLDLDERAIFAIGSRVTSLEMALAEQKNAFKHMTQKFAADKVALKAEISALKSKISDKKGEDHYFQNFKKVA